MATPPQDTPPAWHSARVAPRADPPSAAKPSPVAASPTAFGHRLASTSRSRPHLQPDKVPPIPTPANAVLPEPLLRQLFGYLPLSSHGTCALVCRHWHASLPRIRTDVARWRDSTPAPTASCQLAAGYSSRIRPWLKSFNNRMLPVLDCQHQELIRLQELVAQPLPSPVRECLRQQIRTAQNFLSALVQYSLYQQLIEAPQLDLQPAGLAGSSPLVTAQFSPCSRWLAMAQHDESAPGGHLRLYGWQQGSWQPELLEAGPPEPSPAARSLGCVAFSSHQSDRLFTGHGDGRVTCWSRTPDTGTWHAAPVLRPGDNIWVHRLVSCTNKDLFILRRDYYSLAKCLRPCWHALVLHEHGDGQGWELMAASSYDIVNDLAIAPGRGQVAIATGGPASDVRIDIWQRGPCANLPDAWHCQPSILRGIGNSNILKLHYSPDGQHLLGLLDNQCAALWELRDTNNLVWRIYNRCVFSQINHHLQAQRLFHPGGKQLVLSTSSRHIEFWGETSSHSWRRTRAVSLRPAFDDEFNNNLHYMLYVDSRTLVRVTRQYMDTWRLSSTGHWHRLLLCTATPSHRFRAQACLLPSCPRLCATALWHNARLWIHGEDRQQQLSPKGSTALTGPAQGLLCSPDGLSFLVETSRPPGNGAAQRPVLDQPAHQLRFNLLQLTAPHQTNTWKQAAHCQPALPVAPEADARTQSDSEPVAQHSYAQTLLPELLRMVFNYVPLSSHGACAQVCWHWRNCLPDTRMQLAPWLRHYSASSTRDLRHIRVLTAGCSHRILPWLASHRSRLFPVVQCQHQELLQLRHQPGQQARQGQQEHRAQHLLAGLMRYSVHQQLVQSEQPALQIIPLHKPCEGTLSRLVFSPCGRWLAVGMRPQDADARFLYIYGWNKGAWKETTLFTAYGPVTSFRFSNTEPDTLFSAHDSEVKIWQPAPDTARWSLMHSWQIDSSYNIFDIASMACGDLIVFAASILGTAAQQLVFFSCPHGDFSQAQQTSWLYPEGNPASLCLPQHSWLALGLSSPGTATTPVLNQVHIWKKGMRPSHLDDWDRQVSVLPFHQARLRQLDASHDGRHLLGFFENRQVVLWALDAEYRLTNPLMLCSCLPPSSPPRGISSLLQFQRNTKKLVLASSPHQLQFWEQDTHGRWQEGEQLEMPLAPDDGLNSIMLSDDGRLLARLGMHQVDLWHKDADGHWQWRLQRKTQAGEPAPQAALTGPGNTLCLTAAGPAGAVWIHAPNSRGQLVRKVDATLGAPLSSCYASGDRLSILLLSNGNGPCWQLDFPGRDQLNT